MVDGPRPGSTARDDSPWAGAVADVAADGSKAGGACPGTRSGAGAGGTLRPSFEEPERLPNKFSSDYRAACRCSNLAKTGGNIPVRDALVSARPVKQYAIERNVSEIR